MFIQKLSAEESWAGDYTHKAIITFADLTAAANTQTILLENALQGYIICNFASWLQAPFVFSDGSLVSSAITVGDAGSNNRFLTSTELNNAGSFVKLATLQAMFAYTAASTALNVYWTGTAAHNLNTATAGELHLFWSQCNVPQLVYPQWD
jgi:hypothetical protein